MPYPCSAPEKILRPALPHSESLHIMRRFSCPTCGNEIHFRNQSCVICNTKLAYAPLDMTMWAESPSAQLCANAAAAGCNWIAMEATPGSLCLACNHNKFVPDSKILENQRLWTEVEQAKRMLFYAILRWKLPQPTRAQDPDHGLEFSFLADTQKPDGGITPVLTGHQNGLITINIAESDDTIRVARRTALGEPYRTIIGHMRHEIAHYYWAMLVTSETLTERFRALFGDDRDDYGAALERHYATGAPADWRQRFISSYASAHPWEDFAETWAHWLHIVDGIETAQAYGMTLQDAPALGGDPYLAIDVGPVIDAWVPVTVALNNMNRGMGQPDLYPFVLSQSVMEKLQFINDLIHTDRT